MKKALLLAGLAIMAFSCKEPVAEETNLTLNTPAEVTVATEGDIVTVEFTTNAAWTASLSTKDWASCNVTSGEAGTGVIKVSVLKNDSEDSREATLSINAGTKSASVKLLQLQKNALIVEEAVSVDCNEQDVMVAVKANIDYTVKSEADWITASVATKAMLDSQIALHVALNTGAARTGSVIVSGEGVQKEIVVSQGAFEPIFEISGPDADNCLYVAKEGGVAEFTITSNMEYTVTFDEYNWGFATLSETDGKYTVTVDANDSYAVRSCYAKITVHGIQDEVFDEAGEPTGETTDHVERIYVYQEGQLVEGWRTEFFWDLYDVNSRYSTALAGDYLIVSNGVGVHAFSKATGEYVMNLTSLLPFIPTGITNDDAGNIVISVGGDFPLKEDWSLDTDAQLPLEVYVLPASDLMNAASAKRIIRYFDGFYGYGLNNIRVTGDATKDACITMMSAAGSPGGSYAVCWEVKNGEVAADGDQTPYTDYVTLGWTSEIWNSANMVCKHLGTTADSGIYAIGYDGNYNLHYNPGMSMVDWQEVLVTGSSWAEGYNAMDMIEWNGHKYLGFIGMSYFAYADWDYDGVVDGYMPSYLWLVNIDNPAQPEAFCTLEYYASPDNWCYGNTTDLCLEVVGDDLVAYVLDSSASCILQYKFPKL